MLIIQLEQLTDFLKLLDILKKNKNLLNKKNYTFNYLIFTDGLAVSILLIHKDHFGKKH